MTSPYIRERNALIDRLVIKYPNYPKTWFIKQKTSKLIAMFNKNFN